MEEDIKMIEDVLKDKDTKFWIGTQGIQAIENLIARYKDLEDKWKITKNVNNDLLITLKDCIHKDKVQEKIEDLEKRGYFEEANAMKDLLED